MEKKRIRNYEKEKISNRLWRERNKERVKFLKREWFRKNKEKILDNKRKDYQKNPDKYKRYHQNARKKFPLMHKARHLKKYGINLKIFYNELSKNNNKCACCMRDFNEKRAPQVDHCHETGKFRGIVCGYCNRAESIYRENPEIFERLKKYLNNPIVRS